MNDIAPASGAGNSFRAVAARTSSNIWSLDTPDCASWVRSNGDIHALSTRHVNPFVPLTAVSYPLDDRTRTVALAEMAAGAALRASEISAARSCMRYSAPGAICG